MDVILPTKRWEKSCEKDENSSKIKTIKNTNQVKDEIIDNLTELINLREKKTGISLSRWKWGDI